MINLLPEIYKLRFDREYRWRILVMALLFIDIVVVAAVIVLVPAYLYARAQTNNAVSQTEAAGNGSTLHATLLAQTATLSATLKALVDTTPPAVSFTQIMTIIVGDKPAGVSIVSTKYALAATGAGISLEMQGTAATRDDLANFVNALQAEKRISNINVPISDYAADTAVPFDITVTAS